MTYKANDPFSVCPLELTAMPPSAEDCRAKAFECAELAAKTRDTFSKLLLEQTAEQWYVLAEGAEKYELTARGSPQMGAQETSRHQATRSLCET